MQNSRLISMRPVAKLKPAPDNDKLYKPVSPDDPEIISLAESIAEIGLKEPIVVSLDDYVVSGHRRLVACRIVGLKRVPCRVERVRRGDPGYLALLREYNRQRFKSLDEIASEELVS